MTDSTLASEAGPAEPAMNWVRKIKSRRVWLTGLFTVLAVVTWWFMRPAVVVTRYMVQSGLVTEEVLGTGTLEARKKAVIGPKMAGLIARVSVDQGDRVKEGDVLIYLEDSDFKQQVGVADAEMAAATAALDRLQADYRRAEAVLTQARLGYQRTLASKSALSAQDVDKSAESLAIAEAELGHATSAIMEGKRRLTATEKTYEFQKARLNDTTIEAPFDALVVQRDRQAGDVVTAGSSVLDLVSTDEMWISAWVDETELARLAEGQTARVVFRSEPSVEYTGAVVRVGRETDPETRELVVDVSLGKLPKTWAVGQRAEVYITTTTREAVTRVPAGSIVRHDGKFGVLLDQGGKARWREISVGLRGREFVEVVSGLAPGDVVVRSADEGSAALRDGQRITSK